MSPYRACVAATEDRGREPTYSIVAVVVTAMLGLLLALDVTLRIADIASEPEEPERVEPRVYVVQTKRVLPKCRCVAADPLCSEIPGQTCTP